MNGRSEHQVVTRAGIPIVLGGETFELRPRVIEKDEEWMDLVREKLLGAIGGTDLDLGSVLVLARSSTFALAELIVAYDEMHTVPTWEWIRGHATSQEVQDGFVTLLEHAFPPFGMSRRLIPADQRAEIVGLLINLAKDYLPAMAQLGRAMREAGEDVPSPPEPSTSSPSPSGAATRRRSGRR
jgi:hypothetical protein